MRGNHRTSGEICKKEGGNVFANECRTGIAIIFLEKNNNLNNAPTVYDIRQSATVWQSLSCVGLGKGLRGWQENFVGIELDKEYFEKQEQRFKEHQQQLSLFEFAGGQIQGNLAL